MIAKELQAHLKGKFKAHLGLRQNAREFDYEQSVNKFNNEIANLQISDAQEEARLNAELSRMEGGMAAASARASGTAALMSGFGGAAKTAYETGLIGGDD